VNNVPGEVPRQVPGEVPGQVPGENEEIIQMMEFCSGMLPRYVVASGSNFERALEVHGPIPTNPAELSFYVCRIVTGEDHLKALCLSSTSVVERLRMSCDLLERQTVTTSRNVKFQSYFTIIVLIIAVIYLYFNEV